MTWQVIQGDCVELSHTEDCGLVGSLRCAYGLDGYSCDVGPYCSRCDVRKCSPDCPVRLLDEQTGERLHGAGHARDAIREADATGMWGFAGDGQRFGDSGAASLAVGRTLR